MIMSNQALSELIQRFAISALSRERKAEALNEEILVGKYSGEFYIKTKEGIVLSADIMNRAKTATNEAVRIAELVGMTGEIYHVDFENMVLPGFVDYGDNILQQEPINIPVDAKELLIHLDLDEYKISNGDPQLIHSDGNVKILIEIVEGGIARYVRIDKDLSSVNFNKIPLEFKGNVSSIKIMNITVGRAANIGVNNTILLHNLFVTINH